MEVNGQLNSLAALSPEKFPPPPTGSHWIGSWEFFIYSVCAARSSYLILRYLITLTTVSEGYKLWS